MECRLCFCRWRVQAGAPSRVGDRSKELSLSPGYRLLGVSPFHPWPPPQHPRSATYGAVGCTGANFVPSGVPADLEDATGASVAVDQVPTLQSKAAVRS